MSRNNPIGYILVYGALRNLARLVCGALNNLFGQQEVKPSNLIEWADNNKFDLLST